jgi:hypothetical protein
LYGPHAPRRAFERVHTWVFPFCSKNDESVKAAHEKAGEKLSEIKALGLDDAPQLSVFRRFDGPTWSHRISLIGKLRNLDLN